VIEKILKKASCKTGCFLIFNQTTPEVFYFSDATFLISKMSLYLTTPVNKKDFVTAMYIE